MVELHPIVSPRRTCLFVFMALFIASYGCTTTEEMTSQQVGQVYSPNPPTIESTFAAKTIPPRTIWRLYINASDPDGDIRAIRGWADVPWHTFPVRFNVESDQRQTLSGFVEFDTIGFLSYAPIWIRVQVMVEDRLNHTSELVEYRATFSAGVKPELPPQGVYQQRSLGRVPVETIPPAF